MQVQVDIKASKLILVGLASPVFGDFAPFHFPSNLAKLFFGPWTIPWGLRK